MIARLVKFSGLYHAILQDASGKVHHKKFADRSAAVAYIEGFYHDHKRIVSYEV